MPPLTTSVPSVWAHRRPLCHVNYAWSQRFFPWRYDNQSAHHARTINQYAWLGMLNYVRAVSIHSWNPHAGEDRAVLWSFPRPWFDINEELTEPHWCMRILNNNNNYASFCTILQSHSCHYYEVLSHLSTHPFPLCRQRTYWCDTISACLWHINGRFPTLKHSVVDSCRCAPWLNWRPSRRFPPTSIFDTLKDETWLVMWLGLIMWLIRSQYIAVPKMRSMKHHRMIDIIICLWVCLNCMGGMTSLSRVRFIGLELSSNTCHLLMSWKLIYISQAIVLTSNYWLSSSS